MALWEVARVAVILDAMRRSIAILLVLAGGWTQAARVDCWSGGSPHAAAASGAHRTAGASSGTPEPGAAHAHLDDGARSPHRHAGHHGALPSDGQADAHEHGSAPGDADVSACPLAAVCNASVVTAPRVVARHVALAVVASRAVHDLVHRPDAVTTAEPPPPRLPV